MYKWENHSKLNRRNDRQKHHEYDPKTPTFSSSFLNKSFKNEEKHNLSLLENREEKMSTLRRACFVEKWMEKKVSEKIISSTRKPKSSSSSSAKRTTLLDEFDVQDTLFFSSTSETEYSVFFHRSNPSKTSSFEPPPIPKPVRTRSKYFDPIQDHNRTIESKYIEQLAHNKVKDEELYIKTRSKAQKFYSNLKSLKQPISPGVRLSSFISSLFVKEGKKQGFRSKECKSEQASTCSSASSFSRSCLSKHNSPKRYENGVKPSVRFCPVNVIINHNDYEDVRDKMSTKVARSKKQNQKQLEEVALDLLNGYWDAELCKTNSQSNNDKVNDGSYRVNRGVNYGQEDDDDGFSCSSSDLFELDHLSLIGDELPVYETTRFDHKIL